MADVTLRSKNDGNGAIVSLQVTVTADEEPTEGTPFNPKTLKQLTVAGVAGGETQTDITGSCYVRKGVANDWEILSGGFSFKADPLPDKLDNLSPTDVAIDAFHVGSDGLQASMDTGRVLRLRTFTDDGVTTTSVWHELTTSAGTEKAEAVVNFCATRGIDLFRDKSSHAAAKGVHAAWVRDGNNSAIVFTPPFSLAVVGAVWRPATCWVWKTSQGDTNYDFTDLPFTPESENSWRPWKTPEASLPTATLDGIAGGNPSLKLEKKTLTATGRVTDGVNDLTTAWQYADVKLTDNRLSEFGVWVEWKIPPRSTPSRTAIEAASVDAGLHGLFTFHPDSAKEWSCELGLRPQPLSDRKTLVSPRLWLKLVATPGAPAPAPTATLKLTVTDPHLVAMSPELRFFGPNLTDPDSLPYAPRLADSLVAARVEFSSDDSVEDSTFVADLQTFTITAKGNQVRAWLPLPWAGIDDGTLTGANLPASPLRPDGVGAGGPIVRDRNHGLVPLDVGSFTIEPGTETQLPAITLSAAPTQTSQDDRAQREVVTALLPWVNMRASDDGGTLNVQFTPYHRNMVLEHFEDREASQGRTPTPGVDQPTREPSDARKKRVRDRFSQAAKSVAVGIESPLLNWLPEAPEESVGSLTINRAPDSTNVPFIGWYDQRLTLQHVDADGRPPKPSPFLEADVSWPEGSVEKIRIIPNDTVTVGNASAGHVPPVFLAPAIVAVDARVVPTKGLIVAFIDALGSAYVWSADKARHEAPRRIGKGFTAASGSIHVVRTGDEPAPDFRVLVRSDDKLFGTSPSSALPDEDSCLLVMSTAPALPYRCAVVPVDPDMLWRLLVGDGTVVASYAPSGMTRDSTTFHSQRPSADKVTDVRFASAGQAETLPRVLMAYSEPDNNATLSMWNAAVDGSPDRNQVVTFTGSSRANWLAVSDNAIAVAGVVGSEVETFQMSPLVGASASPAKVQVEFTSLGSDAPLWADGLDPATAFLVAQSKDEGVWLRWSVPIFGNGTSASLPLAVKAHRGALNAIQIVEGADRPQVITGGADGAVAVWDLQSGQEILRLDPLRRRIDTLAVDRDATGPDSKESAKWFDVRTLNWKDTSWRVLSTLAKDEKNVVLVDQDSAGHSIAMVASDLLLKEDSGQWKPVPAGIDVLPVPVGSVGLFSGGVFAAEEATSPQFASWPRIGGWPFLPVGVTFTLDAADSSAVKEITITGLLLNPTDTEDLPERGIPEFARQALADPDTVDQKTIIIVIAWDGNSDKGTVKSVTGGFDWTFQLANQIPPTEAPRSIPGRIERIKGTVGWDTNEPKRLSLTIENESLANALGVSWPLQDGDVGNPANPITLSPESLSSVDSPLLALRESFPDDKPGTLEMRHVLPAVPALPAASPPRSIPLAVGRGSEGEAVVITGATADDLFVTDIDGGASSVRCRDRYRDGVLIKNHRATTDSIVPYEAVLLHVDGSLHVVGAMDSVKDLVLNEWTFEPPKSASPRRFELDSPIEAVVVFDDVYVADSPPGAGNKPAHRLYLCRCADGSARLLDDKAGEVQRFEVPGTTVTAMSFGPSASVDVKGAAKKYSELPDATSPLTYVALGGADGSIRCYEIPHDVASPTSQQVVSPLSVWRQWFDLTGAVTSISLVADKDFYWKSLDDPNPTWPPDAPTGALVLYACSRAGDPPLVREVFRDAQPGLKQTPSDPAAVIVNMRVLTQDNQSVGVWHDSATKKLVGWIKNKMGGSTTVTRLTPEIADGESFSWALARFPSDGEVYLTVVEREDSASPSVYKIAGTSMTLQAVSDVSIDDCLAVHTAVNENKRLLSLLLDATGRPSLYCANDPGNLPKWTPSKSFPFVQSKAEGLAATFSETIVDVVTRIVAGRVEVWDVALDRLRWVSPAASGSFRDDDIQLVRFAFIRQRPILVCGRFGAVEFWNLATGQVEHRFATNGPVTHLDVALDDNGNAKILVATKPDDKPEFTIHSLHDNNQQSLTRPTGKLCNWLRFYRHDNHTGVIAVCGDSDTGPMAGAIWGDLLPRDPSTFTVTATGKICDVFVRDGKATVVASDDKAFGGDAAALIPYTYRILAAGSTGVPTDSSAIALKLKDENFEVGVLGTVFINRRSVPNSSATPEWTDEKTPTSLISIGWQALDDSFNSSPFGIHLVLPTGWSTNLFATDSSLCGVRTRTLPTGAPYRLDAVNWPMVVSVEQGAEDGVVVRCWDRHSGMLRRRFVVADVGKLLPRGLLSIGSGARPAVWIAGTKKIRSLDWGTGQIVDVFDASADVAKHVAMAWSPGPGGDPNKSGVAIAIEQGGTWKAAAVRSVETVPPETLSGIRAEYVSLPFWLLAPGPGDYSTPGGWSLAAVDATKVVTGSVSTPPDQECNLVSSVGAASAIVRPFGGDGSVDHICPLVIPATPTGDSGRLLVAWRDTASRKVHLADGCFTSSGQTPSKLVVSRSLWASATAVSDKCDALLISDAIGVRIVAVDDATGLPVVFSPTPWIRLSSAAAPRADLRFSFGKDELFEGRITPSSQCELALKAKALPGVDFDLTARPTLAQGDATTFALQAAGVSTSEFCSLEAGVIVISGVRSGNPQAQPPAPAWRGYAIWESIVSSTVTVKTAANSIESETSTLRLLVSAKCSNTASQDSSSFEIVSTTVTGIVRAKKPAATEWQMHIAEQPASDPTKPPTMSWAFATSRSQPTSFDWQGFLPINLVVNLGARTIEVTILSTPLRPFTLGADKQRPRRGIPTVRDDVVLPQPPNNSVVVALSDQVVDLSDALPVMAATSTWYSVVVAGDSLALKVVTGDVPLDPLGGMDAIVAMPKEGIDTIQLAHRRDLGGRLRAAGKWTNIDVSAFLSPFEGPIPGLLLLPAVAVDVGADGAKQAQLMYETLVVSGLPLPTRDRGLRSEMQTESVVWVTPPGDSSPEDQPFTLNNMLTATAVAATRGQLPTTIFSDRAIRNHAIEVGANGLLLKRTLDAAGGVTVRFVNSPYHALEPQTLEEGDDA